jgi:RNA polymerase sigma-70 factor (ECF subfamily)
VIEARARGAWAELEAKLRPFIARRVRSLPDVDDVVQDVFLRMQRGLPSLQDDDRFGPWVYRIARSAIADHRRSLARHPLESSAALDETEGAPGSPSEEDGLEELVAMYVAPFVALLPSPYREALTLTELEGLTQREAAAMMGISLSGMKSRVQRGRRALRDAFEACCKIAVDARGRIVSCEPRPDGRLPDCKC